MSMLQVAGGAKQKGAAASSKVVVGDADERAEEARGLPEVCEPTAEERAKHCLTRLPI